MRVLPPMLSLLLIAGAPAAPALTPPRMVPIGQLRPADTAQGVVFEGVVTACMQAGGGGYLVQDAGDGDPLTADALLVQDDATPRWPRATGCGCGANWRRGARRA